MAIALTVPQRTDRVVASDLAIRALGPCHYPSPLAHRLAETAVHYVGQADRVLLDDRLSKVAEHDSEIANVPAFELAGPRNRIFFDVERLKCGIVTCGGLCPGINNVLRGLVLELINGYGIHEIYGFRYGYAGVVKNAPWQPIRLTADRVADIHQHGGTQLGTSRGDQDPRDMVDRLEELGIGVLFVIGGDGTLRGPSRSSAKSRGAVCRSAWSAFRRRSTTTSTSSTRASASRRRSRRRSTSSAAPMSRRPARPTASAW